MTPQTTAGKRVDEIDFMKFCFILLMIAFHLTYINGLYPELKRFVYTFHMPAFLLISGYLTNIRKAPRQFLRSMWWLFVPYAVMESGYILMAHVLPINEHIDVLTFAVFAEKLLLYPLGPYWYFHTLVLCSVAYYAVFALPRLSLTARFIVLWLVFYVFSWLGVVSLACACYFLAGAVVRRVGLRLEQLLTPSWLMLVPMIILALDESAHDKATGLGVAIVYLAMSLSLLLMRAFRGRMLHASLYIGRHTLSILLFSPIFTILCKRLVPLFAFEPSGILFALVSICLTIAGSLVLTWILDTIGLSRWFFGKAKAL